MSDWLGTGPQQNTSNTTGTSTGTQTGTTTQTGTNQYQLPDWLTNQSQNLAGQVGSLFNNPFQSYTGQFSAPLASNQQRAVSSAGGATAAANPYLSIGGSAIGGSDISRYMNPFIQRALNPTLDYMKTQFVGQNNALRDQAAGSGAYGGDRQALLQSQAQYNQNMALGNFEGQGMYQGFNTAAGLAEQDRGRALQAAGLAGQLQGQDFGQLMSSGAMQRGVSQEDLNAKYQEFLRGQGWGMSQLQGAAGVLSQLPHGYGTTSTGTGTNSSTSTGTQNSNQVGTTPGANMAGQLAGLGISAAALTQAGIPQALWGAVKDLFSSSSPGAIPSNPDSNPDMGGYGNYNSTPFDNGYSPWSQGNYGDPGYGGGAYQYENPYTPDNGNQGFDPNQYPSTVTGDWN